MEAQPLGAAGRRRLDTGGRDGASAGLTSIQGGSAHMTKKVFGYPEFGQEGEEILCTYDNAYSDMLMDIR